MLGSLELVGCNDVGYEADVCGHGGQSIKATAVVLGDLGYGVSLLWGFGVFGECLYRFLLWAQKASKTL